MSGGRQTLHASCVAVEGRALLILGPSGSGKSSLALELIALGATLVADDRAEVTAEGAALVARPPDRIAGLIEARGIGILRLPFLAAAPVALAVDLATRETDRLPPARHIQVLGRPVDLVLGQEGRHFPSALLIRLRTGRVA